MSGDSLPLPGGATWRRWLGPESGPVAVCIHGLTTPSYVFAGTARSLSALGFRVLTYDLWGRGRSACPPGRQDARYFLKQFQQLMEAEGISGPVTLAGYSMGGIIATLAAAEGLRPVPTLLLLAPAGLTLLPRTKAERMLEWPILGDLWARTGAGAQIRRGLRAGHLGPTIVPDFTERQIAETRAPGYAAAVLSSRRHTLAQTYDEAHRTVHRMGIPTLAIWGGADSVIGLRAPGRLAELNPDAHHVQIPGAGHALLQTHPREVGEALERFFREGEGYSADIAG